MKYPFSVSDYDAEWALKDYHIEPRSTTGYLSREEVIAFFGTLGLQGVELNHGYWKDYDVRKLKKLLADAGLRVAVYVAAVDLTLPTAALPSALDEMQQVMERTAELGASRIFLIPAFVKAGATVAQHRVWLIDGLRKAAENASKMGITLMCENIDYPPSRPLMGSGFHCRDICAEVNSPAFRLIYDVAAALFVGEDVLQTLDAMWPHVVHVHLKNYRLLGANENPARQLAGDDGKRYTGTTLDAGAIPIPEILKELEQRNYKGFLQVEYQGEDDPRVALKHNMDYLKTLLA